MIILLYKKKGERIAEIMQSSKENPEIEFKKFVKTLDDFNKEGNDIAKLKCNYIKKKKNYEYKILSKN